MNPVRRSVDNPQSPETDSQRQSNLSLPQIRVRSSAKPDQGRISSQNRLMRCVARGMTLAILLFRMPGLALRFVLYFTVILFLI